MTLDEVKAIEKVTAVHNVAAGVFAAYVDGHDGKPWLLTFIDERLHGGISFDSDAERQKGFEDFKRMMDEFKVN